MDPPPPKFFCGPPLQKKEKKKITLLSLAEKSHDQFQGLSLVNYPSPLSFPPSPLNKFHQCPFLTKLF